VGPVVAPAPTFGDHSAAAVKDATARADASLVRCLDEEASARMVAAIDDARTHKDTLGGSFVVVAAGLPVGLGSYSQPHRRLSARLAEALLSIPAIKAVEVGDGTALGATPGTSAHDVWQTDGTRPTHKAGGLEGGLSTGGLLWLRCTKKPLSTLPGGLPSVDVATGAAARGLVERSDVCAVPAAAVVAESVVAMVLCDALLESFGGDSLTQLKSHLQASGPRRR
jgi:chorismate synthase